MDILALRTQAIVLDTHLASQLVQQFGRWRGVSGIYWPQRCAASGLLFGKIVLYTEFLNEHTPLAAYAER